MQQQATLPERPCVALAGNSERPQLLACLKVRDERAAVAFWRERDSRGRATFPTMGCWTAMSLLCPLPDKVPMFRDDQVWGRIASRTTLAGRGTIHATRSSCCGRRPALSSPFRGVVLDNAAMTFVRSWRLRWFAATCRC